MKQKTLTARIATAVMAVGRLFCTVSCSCSAKKTRTRLRPGSSEPVFTLTAAAAATAYFTGRGGLLLASGNAAQFLPQAPNAKRLPADADFVTYALEAR